MRAASTSSLVAALALSLWGCPGEPSCADVPCVDRDGDGVCADCCPGRPCDCDDDDPLVHPGAVDAHLDGYDFDCDGTDLGGEGAPCLDDGECTGRCNPDTASCTAEHERCDGSDADGDGQRGCADLDCAPLCGELIAQACDQATEIEGATAGNLTHAAPLFSSCGALRPQAIHRFTPGLLGQRGELHIFASGLSGLELRTACSDASTSLGCFETTSMRVVEGGVPLYAIAGGEGSYNLGFTFTPAICGDGVVTAPESCDDGDIEGGDGCSGDCQREVGFDPCSLAETLELGITTGTTAGGTSVLAGACGGQFAPERLHQIVPAASGTLQIAVEATAPLAVYALSPNCYGTELACTKAATVVFSLEAVAGEPIIVVVDGESPDGYTLVAHMTAP